MKNLRQKLTVLSVHMVGIIFIVVLLAGVGMASDKVLYDDFSEEYLDADKWTPLEQVLKVENGVLVSQVRGFNIWNSCSFSNPASINSIEASITVIDGNMPEYGWASAIISGTFYQSANGNVNVLLNIGLSPEPGKLSAWCFWTDGVNSGFEQIPVDISVNVPVVTKIEYDQSTNQFKATVASSQSTFSGPTRTGDPANGFMQLATATGCPANCVGSISATFDNVYVNNTLYDDFSTAPLDGAKWNNTEIIRKIDAGKLNLSVHNAGQVYKKINGIGLTNKEIQHIEASFTVKSDSRFENSASGRARIDGIIGNDTYGPGSGNDYNGQIGEIFVGVGIGINADRTLYAWYDLERSNDTYFNTGTVIWGGNFTTAIQLDTPVFLGFTVDMVQKQLIVSCNDEDKVFSYTVPVYPAKYPWRGLQSRVYANPGQSGYIFVDVDNVYISNGSSIIGSNSIGSRNTIKISDMSGTVPDSGGAITVSAWDVNGNALSESSLAEPLSIYNYATTSISGPVLAARFLNGTPMLYKFSIESTNVVITNVKNSTDDTFKVPIVYMNGLSNFVSNAIGNYNAIKVSDISGTLPPMGSSITVTAWDAGGNAIPESGSATPLMIYNHGTTIISGSALAARFPTGSPMTYKFVVQSSKVLVTNVKSSTDGKLNVPVSFTSGVATSVSNSIGNYNALHVSDLSGTLPSGGSLISIKAWDAEGNELPESGSATPLMLFNHGTTSISGSELSARFPSGKPILYESTVASATKVLTTNIKSSTDGLVEIPSVFTYGLSNFATNYVCSLTTIKISDMSGTLSAGGAAISITAWDANGNVIPESATPLFLYSYGTTTITGSELAARFPSGLPALYEFSIGSLNAIVTSLTTSIDGTIKTPTVFTIGPYGGI
jgi:hypothetical protein